MDVNKKFICNLCDNTFTQKKNLQAHLREKRCKSNIINDYIKLNELISKLKSQIPINKTYTEISIQTENFKNKLHNQYTQQIPIHMFKKIYNII